MTGNCTAKDTQQKERTDSLSQFQSSLKGAIFKRTTELGAKEDLGGNSHARLNLAERPKQDTRLHDSYLYSKLIYR